MARKDSLIAVCSLALTMCVTGRAQDSTAPAPAQSLGDLARQAQKDKDKDKASKPAAKVITNDDMPSGSASMPAALGANLAQITPGNGTGKSGAMAASGGTSPLEQLGKLEGILDQVESLDRATLIRNALQGNDVNFPGRAKWEERLLAARQAFVAQGRDLISRVKGLAASADGMKGIQDPNDPRVKELNARLQSIVRDATQTGAAFQAVMIEGRDLASQSSSQ